MNDFFIWAKTNKIPYQVYTFESSLEILELKNPENLSEFFKYIGTKEKGFYVCGFFKL